MKNLNRFYPHLLALIGFVLVAVIYFYPVLQGKEIYQSDIVQYTGMAKEQNDFRKQTGEEPYWTNSAFGGMPTYQLGAKYPHNYIKQLDSVLRFLPRPADYLFLYFIGFYILLRVLKVDSLKAFLGALAFGLSTYLVIILGVGHNAKAHAIAYMPMVVAGVLLVFQRRYILGGLLTMVAAALEINANHFQMTYYLLILLLVLSLYFIITMVKNKEFKQLGITFGIFAGGAILAVGANATSLMATSEYAKTSNRGKSELKFNPDGSANTTDASMEYDYITEYSYGIVESLNLIAPRLFGGGNREDAGEGSHMYDFILEQGATPAEAKEFASNVPTYWGDQPIVEAPAYIGAVVFFLAVLALVIDKRRFKYAFLAGAIVSLMLSWGKNFSPLTEFFINYVPMYDKFRAVSSIQVILELCMPVLAIMGLQSFYKAAAKEEQWKPLWQSSAIALGIVALLLLFKGSFSFTGMHDEDYRQGYGAIGNAFIDALKEQRRQMFTADLLRSGLLILLTAGLLWAYMKDKLKATTSVIIIGLLMIGDLFFVDKKYVNADDFVSARQVNIPFEADEADNMIKEDTTHFRVYEAMGRLQARTSYFHNSVGGYSAVRPRRMDQLFTHMVEPKASDIFRNIDQQSLALTKPNQILSMLNVKYVLFQANEGQNVPVVNPFANGPAWFVSKLEFVKTPDEEIRRIENIDTRKSAVATVTKNVSKTEFTVDSTATIKLDEVKPNYLKYTSSNTNDGLAVFSEMYYANGWNAFIDGKPVPHFQVNYVLRAMNVPAGKHTIEFKFEPQVVKTGSSIALISSILMLLLIGGGIYVEGKKRKSPQPLKEE